MSDDDTDEVPALGWTQGERDEVEHAAKTKGADPPKWLFHLVAATIVLPLLILWAALVARLFQWAF